jgi:hypothetical protein
LIPGSTIDTCRHFRVCQQWSWSSGNQLLPAIKITRSRWIPAFAGMTAFFLLLLAPNRAFSIGTGR